MTKQELEEPKLTAANIKKLRPYFDANRTADYAAAKTGLARGTVQKYWRVWKEKLIEDMDDDFIKSQKEAKARGLLALDTLIGSHRETLAELKILNDGHMQRQQKLWKKDKTHEIEVNKYLVDRIARFTKQIFDMEQIKVQIQMKPTADVTLQLQIDEMLAKVKPEDLQKLVEEAKEKEGKED